MIKKLTLILIFLISGIAFAQQADARFELVIGPTVSKIVDEDLESIDFNFGLNGGFLYWIPVSSSTHLRIGALYNQKGFKMSNVDGYGQDLKFTTNYLTIPAHITIATSQENHLYFGPELNILLSATVSDGDNSSKINDGISETDLSLAGGLTTYISEKVSLSLGVSYGLVKVLEISGYKDSHIGHNISFPINLGIAL